MVSSVRIASLLVPIAVLSFTADAVSAPQGMNVEAWSVGSVSWRTARKATGSRKLWDQPNSCDASVLRSSGPLTALFGLSSIWGRVQQRREAAGRTEQPLEVHVLGASYPFEGRSDWSLLNDRRPVEVPRLRVTLVLGTPFQVDNVPPLARQKNTLLDLSGTASLRSANPNSGKWSNKRENIICEGDGKWGTEGLDQNWSIAELCRDHGNGLEVVCLEKFYQDVRDKLPKPDVAVFFSPGFPQMARRTWDTVLIGLLNSQVPIILSDAIHVGSWGYKLKLPAFYSNPVLPGGKWKSSKHVGEDWQTWLTMSNYKAKKLRARRNPFPILHREGGTYMAKNAVVQIFEGFRANSQPTLQVSQSAIKDFERQFRAVNWTNLGSRPCKVEDVGGAFGLAQLKKSIQLSHIEGV